MSIPSSEYVRGKLRLVILYMLSKEPKHGYSIIKSLEEIIGYSPSPGTIYPLLKDLLKNGFIEIETIEEGKGGSVKIYRITSKGLRYLEEHSEELNTILRFMESARLLREMGASRFGKVFRRLMDVLPLMSREQQTKIASILDECSKKILEVIEEVEING